MLNYRDEVHRTMPAIIPKDTLILGAMGLCGEAGEASEIIKKYIFQGVDLDRSKLIKELGDVRWYLEVLCICLNTDINQVEQLNVAKLRTRYPEGFTSEASATRKDIFCEE